MAVPAEAYTLDSDLACNPSRSRDVIADKLYCCKYGVMQNTSMCRCSDWCDQQHQAQERISSAGNLEKRRCAPPWSTQAAEPWFRIRYQACLNFKPKDIFGTKLNTVCRRCASGSTGRRGSHCRRHWQGSESSTSSNSASSSPLKY
jgi:hypothetical protein